MSLANSVLVLVLVLMYYKVESKGDIWEPLLLLAGILGVLMGNLLLNQNKMLYAPVIQTHADFQVSGPSLNANHPDLRKPSKLLKFTNLTLLTKDRVEIHAWLFPSKQTNLQRQVLIYLHGNAGNIGHRIPTWQLFHDNLPETDLLCFDYRGFGNSQGEPSEPGLVLDCLACIEHCQNQGYQKIILFGTSLGGAVAVQAWSEAGRDVVHSLVLENAFTSVCDVACALLPVVAPFRMVLASEFGSQTFLTNVFDTRRVLQRAAIERGICPVLILRGELDEIVPPSHSLELYELARAKQPLTTFVSFPNGSHNNLAEVAHDRYFQAIRSALKQDSGDGQ
ncbi:hypothetical protein BASA81_009061 [Batrachochytrium salamandrivorans]|nr:hypothetical protein BASA81_009061 [Batrachochytrium salamandrivorans]